MPLLAVAQGKLQYLPVFVAVLLLFLTLSFTKWAYKDAKLRGSKGISAVLIVFLIGFPVGLLIWLSIRPPLQKSQSDSDTSEIPSEI